MKNIKKIVKWFIHLFRDSVEFIIFLLYLLRQHSFRNPIEKKFSGTLVVLANGPSLTTVLDRITTDEDFENVDFMAMNYMANTEKFWTIKPKHYCLTDPIFFCPSGHEDESIAMYRNMEKVDWNMNIYIPKYALKHFFSFSHLKNPYINVIALNTAPYLGFENFRNYFYKAGLSMPCSQTVAIQTIYVSIMLGYSLIKLYGVDHSYTVSLCVNDNNEVCRRYEHFYKSDDAELKPIGSDMVEFFSQGVKVFKGHKYLAAFAKYMNVCILNCTKGSFIDVYERKL